MSKRPEPSETLSLALEILRRIPRGRDVTAESLREQLAAKDIDRDIRSIQRQLKMLCTNSDIVCNDQSKPYGYRWKKNSAGIALSTLDPQESLMLSLAEQHLRNLLPAKLMKSMDDFFTQARSNLGAIDTNKRSREWLSKVRVVSETQPLLGPPVKPEIFETVSNALFADLWLELDYKNAKRETKVKKNVMPLGLVQQGQQLYLICRFRGYDNERNIALHRIVSAKASTLTFERPAKFNLVKYDEDGRFAFGEGKKIKLIFQIQKKVGQHLLEYRLSTDQEVKELIDDYEIRATVVDSKRLEWWLNGFGKAVSNVQRLPLENNPTPEVSKKHH